MNDELDRIIGDAHRRARDGVHRTPGAGGEGFDNIDPGLLATTRAIMHDGGFFFFEGGVVTRAEVQATTR